MEHWKLAHWNNGNWSIGTQEMMNPRSLVALPVVYRDEDHSLWDDQLWPVDERAPAAGQKPPSVDENHDGKRFISLVHLRNKHIEAETVLLAQHLSRVGPQLWTHYGLLVGGVQNQVLPPRDGLWRLEPALPEGRLGVGNVGEGLIRHRARVHSPSSDVTEPGGPDDIVAGDDIDNKKDDKEDERLPQCRHLDQH